MNNKQHFYGSSPSLIRSTVPAFACRSWGTQSPPCPGDRSRLVNKQPGSRIQEKLETINTLKPNGK